LDCGWRSKQRAVGLVAPGNGRCWRCTFIPSTCHSAYLHIICLGLEGFYGFDPLISLSRVLAVSLQMVCLWRGSGSYSEGYIFLRELLTLQQSTKHYLESNTLGLFSKPWRLPKLFHMYMKYSPDSFSRHMMEPQNKRNGSSRARSFKLTS